ncbi:helix-turn-helix domain-containing protein [Nocardia nova]|uniref:helix-turn-helix domain-containing protein n=1 Tax=Nocardia nova TaxID=37330 RepID=UPI0033C1CB30
MNRGPTESRSVEPGQQSTTVANQLARDIKRLRLEAGISQRALAAKIGYSRQYVSMTEWEDSALPSQELVEAIDTALGADGALVALRDKARDNRCKAPRTHATQPFAPSGSNEALTANVLSPFDLAVAPADYMSGADPAKTVARSDVDRVREATRRAATTENLHGGGSANATAAHQLFQFAPLLRGRITTGTRRALFEAVGNLGSVAAFTAFDIGDFAVAEQHSRFALWCADAGEAWELRATTLADMARMTAYTRSVDDALTLIELARVRSDRLSTTTRAMLGALRAQFLALVGRTDEALKEVAYSDEQFADRAANSDVPWMCYYDEAEHMGSTGKALIPVAITRNRIDMAASRIGEAIRQQGKDYPRSRTFSLTRLATLTMRIGDPREAAAIGMQAVEAAKMLDSQRIRDELGALSRVSIRFLHIPEVDRLHRTLTSEPNSAERFS